MAIVPKLHDAAEDEMHRVLPELCGDDQTTTINELARAASCCLAGRLQDSDVRQAVMRGGGHAVMRGRVQWRWEAPGGGGARGRQPPGSMGTRACGVGASYYLLGAIEHDEAWRGYTVLRG